MSFTVPADPQAANFKRIESDTLDVIDGRRADMYRNVDVKHVTGGATTNERIYLIHRRLVAPRIDIRIVFHYSCSTA